jgi:DNA gyrase subunit A
VRTPINDISILARNTQGVTLIRLGENEQLVQIEAVAASPLDDDAINLDGESAEAED